jgi:integral membrane sensor domain MASE1
MTVGQPSRRRHLTTGLAILATMVAYFLTAFPGVVQQLGASGQARLVWPSSGVALAAVLILGVRVWPGVALGSFLTAVQLVGRGPLVAAGLAVGTTVGTLLAYVLLRRAGFKSDLARVRDALALVLCGAVAGMAVGSAIRSGVLVLAGVESPGEYWALVARSWLGTGLGVLVITPFLLVLRGLAWRPTIALWRLVEALGLVLCTVGVTWVVTTGEGRQGLFLVFPLLIWAAWRFQLYGAAPCVVAASVVTVYAALQGAGPFDGGDPQSALVTSQAFVAAIAATTLFLAVAVTERNAAREEIDMACHDLVKVVSTLDERLRPHDILTVDAAHDPSQDLDPCTEVGNSTADIDTQETRTEPIRHLSE